MTLRAHPLAPSARALSLCLGLALSASALGGCGLFNGTAGNPDGSDGSAEAVCVVNPNVPTRLGPIDPTSSVPRAARAADSTFDLVYLSSLGGVAAPTFARVKATDGVVEIPARMLAPGPASPTWIAPGLGANEGSAVAWVEHGAGTSGSIAFERLEPSSGVPVAAPVTSTSSPTSVLLRAFVASAAAPPGYTLAWDSNAGFPRVTSVSGAGLQLAERQVMTPGGADILDAVTLAAGATTPGGTVTLRRGDGANPGLLLDQLDAMGERAAPPTPLPGTEGFTSPVLLWDAARSQFTVVALRASPAMGGAQLVLARFSPSGTPLTPALMLVGPLVSVTAGRGDGRAFAAASDGARLWLAWNDSVGGASLGRVHDDASGVVDVTRIATGRSIEVGSLAVDGGAFLVGGLDATAGPAAMALTGRYQCP